MSATNETKVSRPTRAAAPPTLPTIEIRFTPIFAWMLIGFGAIFFFLSFFVGHRIQGLGLFIALASMAAMVGGNYWRQHLHIVARMTPRLLILGRRGTLKWSDIADIEKKSLTVSYRGVHRTEYVCIKLTARPKTADRLQGFFDSMKFAALGFDIVIPDSELSCTADWFIDECRKRMANLTAGAA
jgi:hypothetical protein